MQETKHSHSRFAWAIVVALLAFVTCLCTAQQAHAADIWPCNLKTASGYMPATKSAAMSHNLNSSSYTVYPSGDKSGRTDFVALDAVMGKVSNRYNQNWDHRNKKVTVRLVPGKTYYIDKTLKLYNNVTFIGTGATLRQVTKGKGVFINALYKDSSDNTGSKKKIGGYSRCSNIAVTGGTYVTTGQAGNTKRSKNGWRFGYSTFLFMHGNNIRISGVTISNNYNGHWIEFAGCRNVSVKNSTFNGSYKGDSTNEVIQLDATKASSNSPQGAPWDGTVTKDVTVSGCKFNVPGIYRGIGTNSQSKKKYSNIKVLNNTFKVKKYGIAFEQTTKCKASGNEFSKGKKVLVKKSSKVTLGKTEKRYKCSK